MPFEKTHLTKQTTIGYRYATMNETVAILVKVTPEFADAIDAAAKPLGLSRQEFFIELAKITTRFEGEAKRRPGRPKKVEEE